MITKLNVLGDDGWMVDTWFDRISRNHITQLKSPAGYQIGDAMFAGDRDSRDINHQDMINEAEERALEELNER